jgi:hypothetical protein
MSGGKYMKKSAISVVCILTHMIVYVGPTSLKAGEVENTKKSVNRVGFVPTCNQEWVKQLNDKKFAGTIKEVESSFGFDDGIDGIKGQRSKDENCLYASLVLGENKKAVLDGLYYFQRCLLKNEKDSNEFLEGYVILSETAQQSFGVTKDELAGISIRANCDHWLENNEYAIKLKNDGHEDLVEVVARAYVTGKEEEKHNILEKHKGLVSQVPMPTETIKSYLYMVALLTDVNLLRTMRMITEKAINNDSSYKTITLATDKN